MAKEFSAPTFLSRYECLNAKRFEYLVSGVADLVSVSQKTFNFS